MTTKVSPTTAAAWPSRRLGRAPTASASVQVPRGPSDARDARDALDARDARDAREPELKLKLEPELSDRRRRTATLASRSLGSGSKFRRQTSFSRPRGPTPPKIQRDPSCAKVEW